MNTTREYRNKVFGIIYHNISNKHPDWSHNRIKSCTIWAMRHKRRSKKLWKQII